MPVCRLRFLNPSDHSQECYDLNPSFDISVDQRLKWTKSIITLSNEKGALDCQSAHIRDWDFILKPDGSVEIDADNFTPDSLAKDSPSKKTPIEDQRYPASYQLPHAILHRLDNDNDSDSDNDNEKISRTERFALGSILYHVNTSQRPFHNHSDKDIHDLFAKGEFPEDTWNLPAAKSILCYWCPEFAAELHVPLQTRLATHIRQNPGRFTLQVLGTTASIASLAAFPVLGAVGFGAAGPVAGSIATTWQASIGAVSAGSVFAWCQSAAMGGAAASSIIAAGVSGFTLAAGSTALQVLEGHGAEIPAGELKGRFEGVWKKRYGV